MATPKEPGAAEAIEQVLARLAARTPRLDTLDDEIGRLIARTERGLHALNLGVRMRVATSRESEDGYEFILFDKINGVWRLAIVVGQDRYPNAWISKPLADCDRETRLRAWQDGWIERLLIAAAEQLDASIEEREAAIENGRSLVEAIERVSTKRGAS